jgi:hypothetical protein
MKPSPPEIPRAILVVGWTTAFASIFMIVMNIFSLVSSAALGEMIPAPTFPGGGMPPSVHAVLQVYQYGQYWLVYGILYFSFVLVAALQFLRLKAWGRKAFEAACWIGIINAFADTAFSYYSWNTMRIAMGDLIGQYGGGLSGLHQLGLAAILFGFVLWIVPSAGFVIFVRRASVRQAMSL